MNNRDILLSNIGLNSRDAKVYLALLALGEATVLPISKQSGIKRTYCYDILTSLQSQGLVSYIERNGRRRYSAQPPETIQRLARERLDNVTKVLPELKSIAKKASTLSSVQYYEGKEGIKSIYEQIIGSDSLDAIASPDHIYATIGEYFAGFAKRALKKKMVVRELIAGSIDQAPYLEQYKAPLQQIRQLPLMIKLETDILLFENKLAMISYGKQLHAIVLEGSTIVDTHKQLFELLWHQADQSAARTYRATQSGSFEDEDE